MADLAKALPTLLRYEGGYANDPADAGAETLCGISRRYFPGWHGWALVDSQKAIGQTIDPAAFEGLVRDFYRQNFWNRFQGDRIRHQALAEEILDQAVNLGVHRAVSHLQRALNALNAQAKLWPDIPRDGELGPGTLAALDACVAAGRAPHLLTAVRCQQGCYYLERMEERGANERFAAGWMGRV